MEKTIGVLPSFTDTQWVLYGILRVYNFGAALHTVPLVAVLSVIMSKDI